MRSTSSVGHVEQLEPRRLLTFTLLGPEQIVPATANSDFTLAVAGDGTYIIATTKAGTSIVQRYGANDSKIGSPLTIKASVSVSMDAKGDAVLAYKDTQRGIVVRRISRTGVVSTLDIVTSTGDSPDVSMDDNGRFWVGWSDATSGRAYLRPFYSDGSALGDAFLAADPGYDLNEDPPVRIAALPDGEGVRFVYPISYYSDSLLSGLADQYGVLETSQFAGSEEEVRGIAARVDAYYVATDFTQGSKHSVLRNRDAVESNGDDSVGLGAVTESVAVDTLPSGDFVASYERVTTEGSPNDVYAVVFAPGGTLRTRAIKLGTTSDITPGTEVASAGDGTFIVAWNGASDHAVHYRRVYTYPDFAFTRGSELYLLGTPGAELLLVRKSGTSIIATRSKTSRTFDASSIQALTINGYAGDDDIVNSTGLRATIQGGDGNDRITSAATIALYVEAGDGNDTVSVADNGAARILGGKGDDSLVGGAGKQFFDGESGNDTIQGGDGNDRITGGEGNDRLLGGSGNDIIDAGSGRDFVDAGRGDDVIYANDTEVDNLLGGRGNDLAYIDSKLDRLDGVETRA